LNVLKASRRSSFSPSHFVTSRLTLLSIVTLKPPGEQRQPQARELSTRIFRRIFRAQGTSLSSNSSTFSFSELIKTSQAELCFLFFAKSTAEKNPLRVKAPLRGDPGPEFDWLRRVDEREEEDEERRRREKHLASPFFYFCSNDLFYLPQFSNDTLFPF